MLSLKWLTSYLVINGWSAVPHIASTRAGCEEASTISCEARRVPSGCRRWIKRGYERGSVQLIKLRESDAGRGGDGMGRPGAKGRKDKKRKQKELYLWSMARTEMVLPEGESSALAGEAIEGVPGFPKIEEMQGLIKFPKIWKKPTIEQQAVKLEALARLIRRKIEEAGIKNWEISEAE